MAWKAGGLVVLGWVTLLCDAAVTRDQTLITSEHAAASSAASNKDSGPPSQVLITHNKALCVSVSMSHCWIDYNLTDEKTANTNRMFTVERRNDKINPHLRKLAQEISAVFKHSPVSQRFLLQKCVFKGINTSIHKACMKLIKSGSKVI